ncbi:lytic transglycosylase domain-containing protein [Polynucleobacter sp. MWH-P3-07-1]|uniref:transglycosylase SLT domain-containing protein n=1 Tax=Polynucleobacter sp. MWH-P3-07-1 TaxID=1743173 RepID=UPI001BFDA4B6|nr:lytic transglycosylase domain-containing protein [Polynucleobacter sp. MWH-P3-07-1]QWD83848.1 lytic transglycosylase domain-containing protein [Polynucleobacter sp. MWH-P3-07-1]
MSKCLTNNSNASQLGQSFIGLAQAALIRFMDPVYRGVHGLLIVGAFLIVGLWLSGNGTNAGPFDLARILVPDEARQMFWQGATGSNQSGLAALDSQTSEQDIAHIIYGRASFPMLKQETIALLNPEVARIQVKSISHLADQIPTSKIDPLALDSNLMSPVQNQRAVAEFFEKKYGLDKSKIEEYVSNAVLISREVKIDPVLLLAVMSVESNFNPMTKSEAGAEGLMQVMTNVHKEKYAPYGGVAGAVKPEVNIRIGAYILKYLIATSGSLRNGLKFYVGAGNADNDGGYADKVMAERNRIIELCKSSQNNKLALNGKKERS